MRHQTGLHSDVSETPASGGKLSKIPSFLLIVVVKILI